MLSKNKLLNYLVHKRIVDRLLTKPLYAEFLEEVVQLKISEKYPQLSESELIVCGLISLSKSMDESLLMVNRMPNYRDNAQGYLQI